MDLAISLLGEALLITAIGLDLRHLGRQGDSRVRLEPFRIWLLRVYFFSVLALPFYFWRTRGRARWALVGIASGIAYLLVLEGVAGLAAGCSASSAPARPDARTVPVRIATDAGPLGRPMPHPKWEHARGKAASRRVYPSFHVR